MSKEFPLKNSLDHEPRKLEVGMTVGLSDKMKEELGTLLNNLIDEGGSNLDEFRSVFYYTDFSGYKVKEVEGDRIKISAKDLGSSKGINTQIKEIIEKRIFKPSELTLK